MIRSLPYLLILLLYTVNMHAQYDSAIVQANEISANVFEEANLPGMAVGVLIDGNIVWTAAYGHADIESGEPIYPDKTLFRIGSVSKTLTGVGLLQLTEQDKIDLDTEIQDYVPSFPPKKYPVTVRQLALHVGGIRHYEAMEFMSNVHYPTVTEGLRIFEGDPLLFEPGTQYSYSSYGWNLISAAMESASGEDFLSYMQKHVFKPAKMKNTHAEDVNRSFEHLVTFYLQNNEVAPFVDNSYKWAGGGFISTAEDLLRFGEAVMDGKLINHETMTMALQTHTLPDGKKTNRGIGFAVGEDKKGRTWIGHGGGSVGGSTMFLLYPQYDMCVVMLINQSRARSGDLAFRIAEQFISALEYE
jgi:CubicO group peptidase (beta-lactamase class C family)